MRAFSVLLLTLGATLCTVAAGLLYINEQEKREVRFQLLRDQHEARSPGELFKELRDKRLVYQSLYVGSAGAGCLGMGIGIFASSILRARREVH